MFQYLYKVVQITLIERHKTIPMLGTKAHSLSQLQGRYTCPRPVVTPPPVLLGKGIVLDVNVTVQEFATLPLYVGLHQREVSCGK